jgi:class 3 adenylate cyclase
LLGRNPNGAITVSIWQFVDDVAADRKQRTKGLEVIEINRIPTITETKLEVNRWYRIDEAVAVFADMRGSTRLSASKNASTLGKMYELFTGGWVKVLHVMKAGYVDIKGDGGFGLFYGKVGVVQALLAAITFRTLIETRLCSYAATLTDGVPLEWELSAKVGVHKGPLLVKKIGERSSGSQKNWLVWAGKPVNYAAKLSSLADPNSILATKPILDAIENTDVLRDHLTVSCGCPGGTKQKLWKELDSDVEAVRAVGDTAVYRLGSTWCSDHGDDFFDILRDYLANKNGGVEVAVPAL